MLELPLSARRSKSLSQRCCTPDSRFLTRITSCFWLKYLRWVPVLSSSDISSSWPFTSDSISCTVHRLNSSSRHVLTATSLSYGKAKNSTPHRIKTPDPIKIRFGTVDYVGEMTPHAKFHVNLHKGGFSANRWNIRKNFCSCTHTYTFFQKLTYRSDPSADFCVQWHKGRGLAQGCSRWGLEN